MKLQLTPEEELESYTIQATAAQWLGFAKLMSEALPEQWRQENAVTDEKTSRLMKASLPVMHALSQVIQGIESNHLTGRTSGKHLN